MTENKNSDGGQVDVIVRSEDIRGFGVRLREIRRLIGLTQLDVEDLTGEIAEREGSPEFTVVNSRLSIIENGRALPGPAKLLALAEVYGLSREQLTALWSTINGQKESEGQR